MAIKAKRKRAARLPAALHFVSAYLPYLAGLFALVSHHVIRIPEVVHLPLSFELLRRRRRWRWRLVRRNGQRLVELEARARRNQAAHRDVFLQAAQVVDLAGNRRL